MTEEENKMKPKSPDFILVITETSTYRLSKEKGDFVLTKTERRLPSAIGIGRTFKSKNVALLEGVLQVGDMNTSLVQNYEEVAKWIETQV